LIEKRGYKFILKLYLPTAKLTIGLQRELNKYWIQKKEEEFNKERKKQRNKQTNKQTNKETKKQRNKERRSLPFL
jgi:hypothetical protein